MSGEGPGNGRGVGANLDTMSAHRARARPVKEPDAFSRAFGDRTFPKIIRALEGSDLVTRQQALTLLLDLVMNPYELEKGLQQEKLLPLLLDAMRSHDAVAEPLASVVLARIARSYNGRAALEKQATLFESISTWIGEQQPSVAASMLEISHALWKLTPARVKLANEDFAKAVAEKAHAAKDPDVQAKALDVLGELVAAKDALQLVLETEAVPKCVQVLQDTMKDSSAACGEAAGDQGDTSSQDDVPRVLTPQDRVLNAAALCLACASESAMLRDIALSEGAIDALLKIVLAPAAVRNVPAREAREFSLRALKFLALENTAKLDLVERGGTALVEGLLRFAADENPEAFGSRLHAIQVMTNMAEHPKGRAMLLGEHNLDLSFASMEADNLKGKPTAVLAQLTERAKGTAGVRLTTKQREVYGVVSQNAIDVILWEP